MDVHPTIFVGNAKEWVDFIIPMHKGARISRHAITNPMIVLRGDRAFCESQYVVSLRVDLPTGGSVDVHSEGRYLDVLERRDEIWKISHRLVINDKKSSHPVRDADESTLGKRLGDTPNYLSSPSQEDPVYLEFGVQSVRPSHTQIKIGMFDQLISSYSERAPGCS